MNLEKNDIQNIADGRTYGGKGLGFLYRFFSSLSSVCFAVIFLYFIFINEASPFETISSVFPQQLQHAPPWLYVLFATIIILSSIICVIISRILKRKVQDILEYYKRTGDFPKIKAGPGGENNENVNR